MVACATVGDEDVPAGALIAHDNDDQWIIVYPPTVMLADMR